MKCKNIPVRTSCPQILPYITSVAALSSPASNEAALKYSLKRLHLRILPALSPEMAFCSWNALPSLQCHCTAI